MQGGAARGICKDSEIGLRNIGWVRFVSAFRIRRVGFIRKSYSIIGKSDLTFRNRICNFTISKTLIVMEDKIVKALEENGAMKAGDLAAAAGISKDDAAKAVKKLVAEGKVYSPKRCFYDLKK